MLVLSFTFPAGRYHATPWDRHVNEGAVAWPPEPWRLLRSLIATWHHKVKHTGKHDEKTLRALIESLAQELPEYRLPAASHSHTRHFMPQFAAGKTSLIFDAFAAVKRDDPLIMVWSGLDLPEDQLALLDELLEVMGYMGRAESWVEAQRITDMPETDCVPGDQAIDTTTGEIRGEIISLYAALPAGEYQAFRQRFRTDKKAQKKFGRTLPDNLVDALSVVTDDLRKQGWSQPPAARKVRYLRPIDALKPRHAIHEAVAPRATTAVFLLLGKPLPRVEDSLRVGELMRMAVMGQARRLFGENGIPPIFSGHDMPKDNRHRHAFYLPWDSNRDGRIDRILLHVPQGMNAQQQRVLGKLGCVRSRDGSEWHLVLEGLGGVDVGGHLAQESTVWQSVTPYLHPWHIKKRFGVEEQIRRECRIRGLPEPVAIESLATIDVGKGRERRPIHFHRFRSKRGLTQPDRRGSFWRLRFAQPVDGPLALGFACHFGMGLFKPVA